MSVLGKFRRACRRDGFWGALRLVARNLAANRANRPSPVTRTPFDEMYGVDTDAWVEVDDLGVESPSKTFACIYAPSPIKALEEAMALLNIDHGAFTFVDLGSGKGRALMLAAKYPFRQIVGVEFSTDLHRIAVRNLEIYSGPRLCADIQPTLRDAAGFEFPDTPLVVLLYNPFMGRVMQQVVGNLERSVTRSPRPVYVLYVNPRDAGPLNRSAVFQELAKTTQCLVFAAATEKES